MKRTALKPVDVRLLYLCGKAQLRRPVNALRRYIHFIGGRYDDPADPGMWGFEDVDGCWHVLGREEKPWTGEGIPGATYRIACQYGEVGETRRSGKLLVRVTDVRVECVADDRFEWVLDVELVKEESCPE